MMRTPLNECSSRSPFPTASFRATMTRKAFAIISIVQGSSEFAMFAFVSSPVGSSIIPGSLRTKEYRFLKSRLTDLHQTDTHDLGGRRFTLSKRQHGTCDGIDPIQRLDVSLKDSNQQRCRSVKVSTDRSNSTSDLWQWECGQYTPHKHVGLIKTWLSASITVIMTWLDSTPHPFQWR